MTKKIIYIVDDEEEVLRALGRIFIQLPIEVKSFTSPSLALSELENDLPAIVFSDFRMPFMNGLEFLEQVKSLHPLSMRVLLSAYQDFEQVVEGFNIDVIHKFISKPWKNNELKSLVSQIEFEEQVNIPIDQDVNLSQFPKIIGESEKMTDLKMKVSRVAYADVPIFISGNTGTGKELVARACHSHSNRHEQPFVAFNCANFSESLLESQLFGHKKGAFTGANKDHEGLISQAGYGTLFLDEVTSMPMNIQAKLLRVLQEKEYVPLGGSKVTPMNASILSASSQTLESATRNGDFRKDLYYRLSVVKLSVPDLHEREQDPIILAKYFLEKSQQDHSKNSMRLSDDALQFLLTYHWPGNVRQLENVILHLVLMMTDDCITARDIIDIIGDEIEDYQAIKKDSSSDLSSNSGDKFHTLESIERDAISSAISQHDGDINLAAAQLGINPSTIYRKIQKWSEKEK